MHTLSTQTDQQIVEDAIADPDGATVSYILQVGDEEFGDKISNEEGEWGTDDSGVNYCDFFLTTPLPRGLEDGPVKFYAVINDVAVPQVTGIDSLSEVGENRASTDPFQARSAFGLANENTLDEEIQFQGEPPESVVRKALEKLPYSRGAVRVQSAGEPILYFSKALGTHFKPEQHPSDILSAVVEKAPYTFRDTYGGGHQASIALALGKNASPVRSYTAEEIVSSGTESEGALGFRPPVRVEPRYSRVVVFRRNPDGSYAFWAEAPVTYRGNLYPPRGRTFYVELEDPTGRGPARAQDLAHQLAGRYNRGHYADELVLPSLDALLERGDAFEVNEIHRDTSGTYQRRWLCWVKYIKKETLTLKPTVGYEALLAMEDKLQIPTLALAGISGGVKRPDYGVEGDDLFFNEPLGWVEAEGDDLIFYDDAPVVVSGDDLVVSE